MQSSVIRFATIALFAITLFSHSTLSQVRRRRTTARQKSARTQQLLPLTPDQKQIVSNFIARANSFELTYQTDQFEYAAKAEGFASFLEGDDIKQFPSGPIKTYLVAMVYGYGDTGILLGMLTHTGLSDAYYSAQAATTGRDGRSQLIGEIGKRWNVNIMQVGLNQAQRRIFSNASNLKDKLSLLLSQTPTASLTSPGSNVSDWIFPKPGMQCRYSPVTKTEMCDLGDSIFAGHIKLAPSVPAVAVVFPLAVPVPTEGLNDADLAMVFASKVVKLHPVLSEARLDQEKENEYRFRTANGKVVIVALATDRRIAIVKFE